MSANSWAYYDVEIFGGVSISGTFTHSHGRLASITLPDETVIKGCNMGLTAADGEPPSARWIWCELAREIERSYPEELAGPTASDRAETRADHMRAMALS